MLHDIRYAIRALRATPVFTAVALLTIALGIGANTAMFTVVRAVLLKPLPYPEARQLVRVRRGTSFLDLQDLGARAGAVAVAAGYRPQLFDYDAGQLPERVDGALVTGRLFELLGATPLAGRLISTADDTAGRSRVVNISENFWRTRLGGDSHVVGRSLTLNGVSYEVMGVVARGFRLPSDPADIFAPFLPEATAEGQARGAHTLRGILRLRQGAPVAAAQSELDSIAQQLSAQYPTTNRDMRYVLLPLADSVVGTVRSALWILFATVGVVLLIACLNVANLLLARGLARRQEIAVRVALGAGRLRLARQVITESLVLASCGGLIGVGVAAALTRAVVGLAADALPRASDVAVDGAVLLFTGAITIATGLLFGLAPSWLAGRTTLARLVRAGRSRSAGSRASSALVVAEVALALVLVASAGVLLRSFEGLLSQPVGFATDRLVTGNIKFTAPAYRDIATRTRYFETLEQELAASPGARSVGIVTELPIGGSPLMHNLSFEGRAFPPGAEPEVFYRGVNRGYFATLGLPIVRGRGFASSDTASSQPVAIANESFARTYYPGGEPVGRRVRWTSGNGEWITIVGLVPDVKGVALDEAEVPALYVPLAQERNWWRMWADVIVRTSGDPAAFAPELQRAAARADRNVPVAKVRTLDAVLEESLGPRRFNLLLVGGFALLAMLLAAAGTYGVMSSLVQQRAHELGIRLALGARPAQVVALVAGRGLVLAGTGIAAGLVLWFVASRALRAMLFGVSPSDPVTLAASVILLAFMALLASAGPALRAARVDPLAVLRSE